MDIRATAPHASDAWIDPDGKFYPVQFGGHCRAAEALGDESGGYGLEDKGWVHFSGGRIDAGPMITQAQINTLFTVIEKLEEVNHVYVAQAKLTFQKALSWNS